MGSNNDSGSVALEGDVVRYFRSDGSEAWSVSLSRVQVIGEMTNDHGPMGDDWFMCFATGDAAWLEFPVYAQGFQELADALTARLGRSCWPLLAGSADYASNVIWPPELSGKPMFKFVDTPPSGWYGKILCKLIGPEGNRQYYSDEVGAFLARTPSRHT